MAMELPPQCQEIVDRGSVPANEITQNGAPQGFVYAGIRIEGLPEGMSGYWFFHTPQWPDPVFDTSDPISTLAQAYSGEVDVFSEIDCGFVWLNLSDFYPDGSQGLVSLESVTALMQVIQDTVASNADEVTRGQSPGNCRDGMSY
jgi:hypothetical protein